jgi:hypothetical protein
MSDDSHVSGPQFRADDPQERDAVRTTIVGGRPPGSGKNVGNVPRGIEVLVKKAAVDPEFREVLLASRDGAADRIGLKLEPAEKLMLQAVPAAQLQAIIERSTVPQQHRRIFLGTAASAMLAVLVGASGCGPPPTTGIAPDVPDPYPAPTGSAPDLPEDYPATTGIAPDLPDEPVPADPASGGTASPTSEPTGSQPPSDAPADEPDEPRIRGSRPDHPPVTEGIRPDVPTE